MKKRRKLDPAFKAKIALEALANDCTINQIAAKHQVLPTQVSQWKRELIQGASSIYEKDKKSNAVDEHHKEVSELHQKIGQLTVESDWLKKKLNH